MSAFSVAAPLEKYIREEIIPETGVDGDSFFKSLEQILNDFVPRNEALLEKRGVLQGKITQWHKDHAGEAQTPQLEEQYKQFLYDIGYLVPEGDSFKVETANVDSEITSVPGPQLVVPINNPRYALNAVNARWGSFFDAIYGTDVIPKTGDLAPTSGGVNPDRSRAVFAYVDAFLDSAVPLATGSYSDVTQFSASTDGLSVTLKDGSSTNLKTESQFVGFQDEAAHLSILLVHNGLHIDIVVDKSGTNAIGKLHHATVKDVILESAMSSILDCEDSCAAVDTEDKVKVYSVWNNINKGTLTTSFSKGGKMVERSLNSDKYWTSKSGEKISRKGRALMLVRNVGLHMFTNAATYNGKEIPEGILDAMVTVLASKHDLAKEDDNPLKNSTTKSIYIVKPKMHGPEEVQFTCDLFSRVEDALGLERHTIKVGIMDEERRTTVNLKECIRIAKHRLFFINTGFLDRTGDEIHTSNEAGPMHIKSKIKSCRWLGAYEDWNVDIGMECGLQGHAQIGKGMWAQPDSMAAMLKAKVNHPLAGANCAWVPSPTAATLHATHYHSVDVLAQQKILAQRPRASIMDILAPPINYERTYEDIEIENDLKNNIQGILGYVVRWIDFGVGCSKVSNIKGEGLMEDRATLRIGSQHIANWLYHKIVTKEQVEETFKKMAVIVDDQNASDKNYKRMSDDYDNNLSFQASRDLVFRGLEIMNGYTEPILTQYRRDFKAKN